MLITLFILAAGVYVSCSKTAILFLDIIELITIDLRFRARGEKAPGSSVVLAVIDEKRLKAEGRWIWPRKKITDLVTRISDAGARVIAFDIVFSEADNDRLLAEAISNAEAKIVLGNFFHIRPEEASHMEGETVAEQAATISSAAYHHVQYTTENAFLNTLFLQVSAPESNLPVIAGSRSTIGGRKKISACIGKRYSKRPYRSPAIQRQDGYYRRDGHWSL